MNTQDFETVREFVEATDRASEFYGFGSYEWIKKADVALSRIEEQMEECRRGYGAQMERAERHAAARKWLEERVRKLEEAAGRLREQTKMCGVRFGEVCDDCVDSCRDPLFSDDLPNRLPEHKFNPSCRCESCLEHLT